MKTIEEEARELYPLRNIGGVEMFQQSAFVKGAKFAQRWIPVEEDNPPVDESTPFIDLKYSISVEVRNGMKIQSAYFNTETGQWHSLITGFILSPTHWRLIELK